MCSALVLLVATYPLALSDSAARLNTKLITEVLETFQLFGDTKQREVTFKFVVVAICSLACTFCSVPLQALGQAIELVADATARVMIELRVAVEVRYGGGRHVC